MPPHTNHLMLSPASTLPPLRLGIAGLGTVGAGVIRLIEEHKDHIQKRSNRPIIITAISARTRNKQRGTQSLEHYKWYDNALDLAHDPEIDIVLELIGGSEGIARTLVETALKNGKSVISANKALIALHSVSLAKLSQDNHAPLLFEASVAGGIPAIKFIREGMSGEKLHYVGGILNGTCNYILSEMARTGRDFDDILKEAQEKGYAESDPSTDIDGWDSAHKLAILAGIAFNPLDFSTISVEGIRNITAADLKFAKAHGYSIKLLGMAKESLPAQENSANAQERHIEAWVRPCLVPTNTALAHVHDVFNAVTLSGPFSGPLTISGRGAGEGPTAHAVIADIIDLARGHALPLWGRTGEDSPVSAQKIITRETSFYLRLVVDDHSGVIADIATILKEQNISVHLISQHDTSDEITGVKRALLYVITHPIAAHKMPKVVQTLANLSCIYGTPLLLPIESLS